MWTRWGARGGIYEAHELGVSVLDIPYYDPVTLIDVLSNGRLRMGFGDCVVAG